MSGERQPDETQVHAKQRVTNIKRVLQSKKVVKTTKTTKKVVRLLLLPYSQHFLLSLGPWIDWPTIVAGYLRELNNQFCVVSNINLQSAPALVIQLCTRFYDPYADNLRELTEHRNRSANNKKTRLSSMYSYSSYEEFDLGAMDLDCNLDYRGLQTLLYEKLLQLRSKSKNDRNTNIKKNNNGVHCAESNSESGFESASESVFVNPNPNQNPNPKQNVQKSMRLMGALQQMRCAQNLRLNWRDRIYQKPASFPVIHSHRKLGTQTFFTAKSYILAVEILHHNYEPHLEYVTRNARYLHCFLVTHLAVKKSQQGLLQFRASYWPPKQYTRILYDEHRLIREQNNDDHSHSNHVKYHQSFNPKMDITSKITYRNLCVYFGDRFAIAEPLKYVIICVYSIRDRKWVILDDSSDQTKEGLHGRPFFIRRTARDLESFVIFDIRRMQIIADASDANHANHANHAPEHEHANAVNTSLNPYQNMKERLRQWLDMDSFPAAPLTGKSTFLAYGYLNERNSDAW